VRLDPRPPGDRAAVRAAPDEDAFRRVVVLDVSANGFPALSGPLSTMALVDEMQKLDNVIVIGPAELSGLMGAGGIEALSTCGEGVCLTSLISAVVAADEVVLVEIHNVEPRPLIFARRLDVRSGERVESAELMLEASADVLAIGESIAIFGAGGIGLNIVQGAALAGGYPVIALDRFDNRLELARSLGATHAINVTKADAAEEIEKVVGHHGVDVAVDNTGNVEVIALASRVTNARGRTVLVGVPPKDSTAAISTLPLHFEKRLVGSHGGECRPDTEIPRYVRLVREGRLPEA
jgi:hypothetical protein